MDSRFTIFFVRGESPEGTPRANDILELDRQNMEGTLKAAGLSFPEDKRLRVLFHPSNRIILAERDHELVGYVDYCDDPNNPNDVYLSSIQIKKSFRGGPLFRILVSHLLFELRPHNFHAIRTNIQKSNSMMIAITTRIGFRLEERPNSDSTLNVFADRTVLESPILARLVRHE